jgi:hypothetical protein
MSTAPSTPAGTDPAALADLDAVLRHVASGTPLDPELVRRVEERPERITDELRRKYGELDVAVELVRAIRDEEGSTPWALRWP